MNYISSLKSCLQAIHQGHGGGGGGEWINISKVLNCVREMLKKYEKCLQVITFLSGVVMQPFRELSKENGKEGNEKVING